LPVKGVEVRIVEPVDGRIESLAEAVQLPFDRPGEIIVCGAAVTKTYDRQPEATAKSKITEGDRLWHRMGDIGFLDEKGRLWFCGRKVEGVSTPNGPLYTEPVEQVFRKHPLVVRCALIGLGPVGNQRAALVVQSKPEANPSALARELRTIGRGHSHTCDITDFYFHKSFPVDVRHNAKIHRLALARWAIRKIPLRLP
jgi:acyl-CoA synthetase (AMP-forming)/AMP-acid ligase II